MFLHENASENFVCEMAPFCLGGDELKEVIDTLLQVAWWGSIHDWYDAT